LWLHSLKVAQLLRSAACLHTNRSRSYLNHLVFAQSLPGQHPMINIQSTLCITPDLCKNVSLHCYLVATAIRIHSLRSQMCIYTYSSQYRDSDQAKEITFWDSSEWCVPRKSYHMTFWAGLP